MKKLLSVMAMFLMVAVTAFPSGALATPILELSDGSTTLTIIDNGPGDANLILGAVTYVGQVGRNWWINVTTGLTTPASGSASLPKMDLNSVDISKGAGNLTLMFSDTGYNLSGSLLATMAIGGTTPGKPGGGLTYTTYFNDNNVPFDKTGGVIGTLGTFQSLSFNGALTNNITPDNLYSLTQVVTIKHLGLGTSSFNATLDLVPLPASALLLGSGMMGLVLLGWRRRQTS